MGPVDASSSLFKNVDIERIGRFRQRHASGRQSHTALGARDSSVGFDLTGSRLRVYHETRNGRGVLPILGVLSQENNLLEALLVIVSSRNPIFGLVAGLGGNRLHVLSGPPPGHFWTHFGYTSVFRRFL